MLGTAINDIEKLCHLILHSSMNRYYYIHRYWYSIDEETEKLNNMFEVIYLDTGGALLLFTFTCVQITWLPI